MRRVLIKTEVQGNQNTLKKKIEDEITNQKIKLKDLEQITFQEIAGTEGEYLATIYHAIYI